jgi:arabinan endo-1,5-alpha-L-arabinosidase
MRAISLSVLLCVSFVANAQDIRVHDPVMTKAGDTYYLFCTGMGIPVFSSKDLKQWRAEKPVFDTAPLWAVNLIPGFKGHIWAPDIAYHNGQYYLYYSVSAFGKNTSCIGVATNSTLDPDNRDFKWIDHGKVIQSVPGRDLWNAIDPNLAFDDQQQPWLAFGSFWSGMKLVRLNKNLKEISEPQEWFTISRRSRDFKTEDIDPGEGAVEAPFIFRKGKFYYLFVSFDFCCRGVKSNYKIMIGRSEKIQGPYLDKSGTRMDHGGGSLLMEGDTTWPGVGHNAVYNFDGKDYLVFHAYDAADGGKPKLKIETLQWDGNDWPYVTKE